MVINTLFTKIKHGLLFLIAVLLFDSSCTQEASTNQQDFTSLSKEIKEISSGILEGYFPEDKIPNSLELIPPPPENGSYPSGHTAIGWAWALILAEVFPEQANEILERGKQFGISRNVCNVHWHSDVVYGRMMGAATVAALHANSDFVIDLEAAKSEILKLK